MVNAIVKWWQSMGYWRWLNGALVLIALVLSLSYQALPSGWTDHGRRTIDGSDIHLDTRGEIRAGIPASARLWISEPVDLSVTSGAGSPFQIEQADFDADNEVEFTLLMPTGLTEAVVVTVSSNSNAAARWNLGKLIK